MDIPSISSFNGRSQSHGSKGDLQSKDKEQEVKAGYSGTTTTSHDSEEEQGKMVKRNPTPPSATVVVNDRDGKTYQNYVREGIVRKRVQEHGVVVTRKPSNAEQVKVIYSCREKSTLNTDFSRGYGSTAGGYGSIPKGSNAPTERFGASTGGHGTVPQPKEEEKCNIM